MTTSFKKFLVESRQEEFTKHIHEYEHHSKGPHGNFGNPGAHELFEALSPEESEAKVTQRVQKPLAKMWEHYGPADSKPAPHKELKARIEKRFNELSKMSDSERQKAFSEAKGRMSLMGVGHPVSSNSKTDTAANIPTPTGPNGQIPLGMSFAPDHAKHYTSPDGSTHVRRNVCAGSTSGCRESCLAKHGNYAFIGNRAAIAMRTQRLTHNAASTEDHATLVYHALYNASKLAEKQGKTVLMRGSVTDDTGADLHHDAIAKHFPGAHQMGYTKKAGTKHDPENNIYTIYSDSGPMVKRDRKTGSLSMERENIQRRAVLRRSTQGNKNRPGMNSYMVFNRKRPSATAKPTDKVSKEYYSTLNSLNTVRRYEPLPSDPKKGEKPEYHNKNGHGRVVHNGQSYRYQDHPVADKIKDISGKSLFPAEHDARNADTSSRTLKTPEGHRVGHVVAAFATSSTSNESLHNSGFFHHVENIDHNGVYHDGHPAEMEKAGFKGVAKDKKLVSSPTGKDSGLEL